MKASTPSEAKKLEDIPNVGMSIASDLRLIGITKPAQLAKQDAYDLYDKLCRVTRQKHDPCVIDVFLSAIYFMQGKGVERWWYFTAQRKRKLHKPK